jgi:hypothetical protein
MTRAMVVFFRRFLSRYGTMSAKQYQSGAGPGRDPDRPGRQMFGPKGPKICPGCA